MDILFFIRYAAKLGGKSGGGSGEPVTGTINVGAYQTQQTIDTELDEIHFFGLWSAPSIPGGQTYSIATLYPCYRLSTLGYTSIAMGSNPNGYWFPLGTAGASHLVSILDVNGGLITISGSVWQANSNPLIWQAI